MNLTIWQTMFLALLQGVTELFPISSLGHTVILPGLFGWGDLVRNDSFLPLIVALHLGTSVALVLYFWRDWLQVGRTLIKSVKEGEVRTGTEEWVSWLSYSSLPCSTRNHQCQRCARSSRRLLEPHHEPCAK